MLPGKRNPSVELMAKCDEGYRCEVCGRDVEVIAESDLYLRYVLGEVPLERLHRLPERHIRCNAALRSTSSMRHSRRGLRWSIREERT